MQLLGVTPHILYKVGGRLTGCSVGGAVVGGQVWHGLVRRTGAGAVLRPAAWRRCPPREKLDSVSVRSRHTRHSRASHSRTSLDKRVDALLQS